MSSYVLDRDLLLTSARKCEHQASTSSWIDVNSNAALLGTTVYQRNNDCEIRKQMADLNDQLKMLRNDVEKKDKLISDLSSMKETERKQSDHAKYESMFSVERQSLELAKKELHQVHAKNETISIELNECKVKVQARDERINELKREMDTLKSENSTMNSLIVTLRNRIRELEGDIGGFETVASKSGITISALQKDNKDLQQTVLELESRIRTHICEREDAERKTDILHNKLNELATQITTITGIHIQGTVSGLDTLIQKISDIVNENSMVKGKLMTTSEHLSANESENKANRETIQRLVNEINKFEKDAANTKVATDHLKAERDSAYSTKTVLEGEINVLKERMTNIQTAWQATRTELEAKETNFSSQNHNLKQMEYDVLYNKNCLTALKEQVAALLSDGFVKVEANEEQIKEKIKLLMTSSKDRGLMIASMEGKVQQLANQLQEQINLYKELEHKYQKAEIHSVELENRFKSLDSEYCANEVLRDNLKSDRIKYLSFLERMGNILKVSHISADVGLDMNVDLIMARAEQLVKMESDSIQDKQTNIYNLQRKVKQLKEQLDNKELHLDLLRKKLSGLEEEKAGKSALEKEVDDHVLMSKKFKSKLEKLTDQLNSLKCENSELKAQLIDFSSIRSRANDQEKEIHKLIEKINDLESAKEKQSIRLAKYREEIDSVSQEVNKTRSSSDTAVQALSQELRHLKQDLDKTLDREKQLMDFRNVVARMLGLDVNALAVADYEIIARIERIITAYNGGVLPVQLHQVSSIPATSTQNYELYTTSSTSGSDSPTRRHHHSHSHYSATSNNSRDRSVSPQRTHSHHQHSHNHGHSHSNHSHHSHSHNHNHESHRHRSKSPRKNVTIDPNSY